jgi:hypothetical protein
MEVKEAAAEVREELQRDVEAARVDAREILYEVQRRQKGSGARSLGSSSRCRCGGRFASGVWAGVHLQHKFLFAFYSPIVLCCCRAGKVVHRDGHG